MSHNHKTSSTKQQMRSDNTAISSNHSLAKMVIENPHTSSNQTFYYTTKKPRSKLSDISQNPAPAFLLLPVCMPACSSAPFPYSDARLLHLTDSFEFGLLD